MTPQGHMMPQMTPQRGMTPQQSGSMTPQQQMSYEYQAMQQAALAQELPSPAGSQRYEQPGSQRNYEVGYGPPGAQSQQQQTIRFDLPDNGSQGMLSRRSMASSHGSLPRGVPQY